MYFLFFFSSRRRHTRSTRDWSSDVCSSDLLLLGERALLLFEPERVKEGLLDVALELEKKQRAFAQKQGIKLYGELRLGRSEERRVGRECRTRRARTTQKREICKAMEGQVMR